jgi:ATP-dependent DNA helicase RecG
MIWNDGQLPDNWTVSNLLKKHASKPYNPDIANTLFRSGYIESWGRGIEKMMNYCKEAGIPEPNYSFEGSDFLVEFRKDIYHKEYLTELGLNERQIKAVLFAKENVKITNSDYLELNKVSKRTATNELTALVDSFKVLVKSGTLGAGVYYETMGQ